MGKENARLIWTLPTAHNAEEFELNHDPLVKVAYHANRLWYYNILISLSPRLQSIM